MSEEKHDHQQHPIRKKGKLPEVFDYPGRKKDKSKVVPAVPSQQPVKPPRPEEADNNPGIQHEPPPAAKQKQPEPRVSRNPLIPARNYCKLIDQFQADIAKSNQQLQKIKAKANHLEAVSKHGVSVPVRTAPPPVRLEDTISITATKLRNGCTLRKILHVPTFKMYFLEEQPLSSNDHKNAVRQWLDGWDHASESNDALLSSHGMHWNIPHGYLSLVYSYAKTVSLYQLADSMGYLPENVLKQIAADIIPSLYYLAHNNIMYNHVYSTQLFINVNTARVQLHPVPILQSRTSPPLVELLLQYGNKAHSQQTEVEKTVFKLGFVLFMAAVDTLTINQQLLPLLKDQVDGGGHSQSVNSQKLHKKNSQNCCFIHKIVETADPSQLTLYSKISSQWSKQFKDFLCGCLRFEHRDRLSFQDLLIHSFVKESDVSNTRVNLKEMLKLLVSEEDISIHQISKKTQDARLQRIEEDIKVAISNCQIPGGLNVLKEPLTIHTLAEETGLHPEQLARRIQALYA